MKLPPAAYRVWQFWQTLTGKLSPSNWDEVMQVLTPREMTLFRGMGRAEQAHGFRVMKALRGIGHTAPDLLAAALLHDVGKSRHPLRLWERPLPVLLKLFQGEVGRGLGRGAPHGWRRPLVVAAQHPAWGADMAAGAGSSPLAAWLIRHHQDENPPPFEHPSAARFLKYLKQADNQN